MLIVILIYDQLLFRPLVAWADRFRFDNEDSEDQPESWVLNVVRRSTLMDRISTPFQSFMHWTYRLSAPMRGGGRRTAHAISPRVADIVWAFFLFLLAAYALWRIYELLACALGWNGIVGALNILGDQATKPLVVRLDGNNVKEGRRILAEAAHPLVSVEETMDGAARKAAELASAANKN